MNILFREYIAFWVHTLTDPIFIFPLCMVGSLMLYLRGYRSSAALVLLSLFLTQAIVIAMKLSFAVARPQDALVALTSYAFPSGHAAISFSIATLTALLLFRHSKVSTQQKVMYIIFAFIIAAFVAYTRIILSVHTWLQISVGALIGSAVPLVVSRLHHGFASDHGD